VLGRLADFLEATQKLKSRVQGAMIYPAVMVVIGSVIVGVLMVKVIPEITDVLVQQARAEVNTKLLINSSTFIVTTGCSSCSRDPGDHRVRAVEGLATGKRLATGSPCECG